MIQKFWLSFSLKKKVKWIFTSAAVAVFLSILINILVASFGMGGMGNILEGNAKSLDFWSAMDTERKAFQSFVREASTETKVRYEKASARTEEVLYSLPFDYKQIGNRGFGKTWSIRNTYGSYVKERDALLLMSKEEEGYAQKYYKVSQMQNYLSTYAGTLEQLTVERGVEEYKGLRPLFVLVPLAAILWGSAALFIVWRLNCSVNRTIIQPVVALAEDSVRISKNDFSGDALEALGQDEIAMLVRAFCRMKSSTHDYITALNERYEMEIQLEEVRLQMLKNQINPHFLFNTLNMIAGTAQIEDAVSTEKMINALSRLFRYNLKSTDSVMPLERELKIISDYMYLQQMRFGQRVMYSTDCEEETLEVLVPVFALQPLVENAIIHGLSPKGQGGKIHIRSWMHEGKIWISVADTGTGIGREQLEEMKKALEMGAEHKTGIGVGNIYRRIHSMYQDGQVTIDSMEGIGTVVQIVFTAG